MKTLTRTASCSCKNLTLECTGEPLSVSLCNCKDCQRRTGSAFGIAAFFGRKQVHIAGASNCYSTKSDSGFEFSFYFCPECGNTIYWETTGKPGCIAVAAGAFADSDFPAPTQSVYQEHQYPWLKLLL